MRRLRLVTPLGIASLVCAGAVASSAALPPGLLDGVGRDGEPHMSMRYEVTMFKIDVADIDVFLASAPAFDEDDDWASVRDALYDASPVTFRMTFVRDSGLDRFLKGTRKSLERAVEGGHLSEDERASSMAEIEASFSVLAERGVLRDDAVYYRVDGDDVRTTFVDANDQILVNVERSSPADSRGTRAMFFGTKSKLAEKLVKSLVGR